MIHSILYLTEDELYLNLYKSIPELILRPPQSDVQIRFPLTPDAIDKLSHILDVACRENEKNPNLK